MAVERAGDAELAIDRVRRGQQLPCGLAAQDKVRALARGEKKGGIRLAAAELLDTERPGEALDAVAQVALESGHIELLPLRNRHRAREFLAVHDP